MRSWTQRDKRTVQLAAAGIALYLFVFYGGRGLEARRTEYHRLLQQAQSLRVEVQRYENKLLLREKLQKQFNLDPLKLRKESLLGEVSAAIQKAAQGGGVQLGPVRETSGNAAARELAAMRLEASGPVPAIMTLLHKLEGLGFPLVMDSVQIDSDPRKPGTVKLTLNLVILDFEQWKKEKEKRNA